MRERLAPARYQSEEIVAVVETGKAVRRTALPTETARRLEDADETLQQVAQRLGLRSYIIAPLSAGSGTIGALLIVSAGRAFNERDLQLAEEFGRRLGYTIENARLFQQAQAASRAKDEFLAVLSHELQTPLTALLGWATMLKGGPFDAETIQTGILAIEQSRTQARLVDDLLDVSRIVSGRLRLEQARVDLRTLLQETVDMVRAAAEEKGVELRLELLPAPIVVMADAARLRQVVWNIIANAIKFTPATGRDGRAVPS